MSMLSNGYVLGFSPFGKPSVQTFDFFEIFNTANFFAVNFKITPIGSLAASAVSCRLCDRVMIPINCDILKKTPFKNNFKSTSIYYNTSSTEHHTIK